MVGSNCLAANVVSAASERIAALNFIFISFDLSCSTGPQNLSLTYITGAPRATVGFAGWLAVGAEVFAGHAAPVDPAGKLVLGLAGGLIVHLFAPKIAAG